MRKKLPLACLSFGLSLCQAESAYSLEDMMPDWSISGYNTYRMDNYEDSGNISASPYPHRGFQHYDDFNLNLNREFSAYENVKVQITGTVDDSEYRTEKEGLIFERGFINWEKADTKIPFRMELGDFFGNQSLRTLQRSLKGAQVELQPSIFSGKSSIQLFGGITNENYRKLGDDKDFFSGASWLLPENRFGAFLLTMVNNTTQATMTNPELSQTVYSFAWNKELEYFQQKLDIEAEYAQFDGDHSSTGSVKKNKNDEGFFTQLKGRSNNLPLDYRFVHERYGDNFRPNGSSITAAQRSTEIHLGWRFATGLSARARLQTFRTNWQSANPTDRDVVGLTFSGLFIPAIQLTGTVGSFISDSESANNATRSFTNSTNASFSIPIVDHWAARLGGVLTEVDNRVTGNATISRQISLGVDHDFNIQGFTGSISPSLNLRDSIEAGNTTQADISPSVSMNLSKGAHNLAFSHNVQLLDSKSLTGTDTDTYQSSLNYSYSKNAHRFEVEGNYYDRNPSPGTDTNAYRIGVSWTYNFDRPAKPIQYAADAGDYSGSEAEEIATTKRSVSYHVQPDMMDLAPGMNMDAVHARLETSGIVNPSVRSGLEIYETPMIGEIAHRQRLGLLFSNKFLDKSVLAIEFDDLGDIDSTSQIFEEVRKVLYDRYGAPSNRIEVGEFSSNLRNDLRTGQFKRIIEWQTKAGILRFGIPYRTDGQIRMEIIHATDFPAGESNFWSIESLR